jgi:hypothetical protein
MDTLRGPFDMSNRDWDSGEDESPAPAPARELPPQAIGQDERRMQVRAYNHWAGLLGERLFPLIADLDPASQPDFGPYSVLLDFSAGIENPAVRFLGEKLAQECGGQGVIRRLSDVPPRSLLSRITDHYMQILANQAPIGFEAEFVNQRGIAILYRGILLPYSSNGETIDFVYGVINWKEVADQLMADELLLEIDQALELGSELEIAPEPQRRAADPVTDWADSPAREAAGSFAPGPAAIPGAATESSAETSGEDGFTLARFADYALDAEDEDYDEEEGEDETASYSFASLADYIEAPAKKAIDPASLPYDPAADADFAAPHGGGFDTAFGNAYGAGFAPSPGGLAAPQDADALVGEVPADAGLAAWLAAARALARAADASEERSRGALYAAVSRAYDFSLAAAAAPEEYAELLAQSGLTVQQRAPMTPVVKLVFGPDYDKTRLTEYAAVLSHAHRLGLERGSLAGFLAQTEGGLKGVVKAERRLRREEQGKAIEEEKGIRAALAQKLRALQALTLEALAGEGPEFALVMVRRDGAGKLVVLGELPEDVPQLERAAKRLVA